MQIHSSFSKSLMVGSGGQNSESDESDPSVVECPVGYIERCKPTVHITESLAGCVPGICYSLNQLLGLFVLRL